MRMAENFVHLSEKLGALMERESVSSVEGDYYLVAVVRGCRGARARVLVKDPPFWGVKTSRAALATGELKD